MASEYFVWNEDIYMSVLLYTFAIRENKQKYKIEKQKKG